MSDSSIVAETSVPEVEGGGTAPAEVAPESEEGEGAASDTVTVPDTAAPEAALAPAG